MIEAAMQALLDAFYVKNDPVQTQVIRDHDGGHYLGRSASPNLSPTLVGLLMIGTQRGKKARRAKALRASCPFTEGVSPSCAPVCSLENGPAPIPPGAGQFSIFQGLRQAPFG